ncbi:MAG: c-type cytochrome [Proteobacteria bacterium]|nr:c-type cytochrome [Pseudomonadota bacterium]
MKGGRYLHVWRVAPLGLAGVLLPLLYCVAPAADAANGARLARQWCAACHVVAADQRSASADVPAFSTIARRPDFDTAKITTFLFDPHPKMPDMSLTRVEAADIAAYIASQR